METELHLPWDNDALQALLQKIILTGETTKVDFKRQLNIATGEHQAELLKDISALANAYDYSYRNHGFIILGVSDSKLTHTKFDQNADGLQARIDELLKNYIEPFIPTQVRIFGSGEETWGVIVVPPTRTAPHVFVKEICKRCRGDIFVRRGTTTDKATPSDYVRFFRLHLDEHTYELREQLEDLKREFATLKKNPPAAPVVAVKTETLAVKSKNTQSVLPVLESPKKLTAELVAPDDLLRAIDKKFEQEEDPINFGLLKEAQKIQKFLASGVIPWGLNNVNKEVGKKQLEEIENCATPFWMALSSLVYKDDKGKYDAPVVRALSCLAQKQNAPVNVSFTDWGVNFRYASGWWCVIKLIAS